MASPQNNGKTLEESANETIRVLCEEFKFKVSYDFNRLVFLTPSYGNVNIDQKLHEIYDTDGYQAHKIVYRNEKMSHIYIRYESEAKAIKAINYFNASNSEGGNVKATKVSDLLLSIYIVENANKRFPQWTVALVDIEGEVLHTNPLSKDVVCNLLRKFGEPRILTYSQPNVKLNHVQALFSSMAEALGASIAHGSWMKMYEPEASRFCYRVRLIAQDKERDAMRIFSGDNCDGVFQLDYFVTGELPVVPHPSQRVQQFNPTVESSFAHMGPSMASVGLPQTRPSRTFSKSRDNAYTSPKHPNHRQNRQYPRGGNRVPQSRAPMVTDQDRENTVTENLPN